MNFYVGTYRTITVLSNVYLWWQTEKQHIYDGSVWQNLTSSLRHILNCCFIHALSLTYYILRRLSGRLCRLWRPKCGCNLQSDLLNIHLFRAARDKGQVIMDKLRLDIHAIMLILEMVSGRLHFIKCQSLFYIPFIRHAKRLYVSTIYKHFMNKRGPWKSAKLAYIYYLCVHMFNIQSTVATDVFFHTKNVYSYNFAIELPHQRLNRMLIIFQEYLRDSEKTFQSFQLNMAEFDPMNTKWFRRYHIS